LAGFLCGDGHMELRFQLKRGNLNLNMGIIISQKSDMLLELIKDSFGGTTYFEKTNKAFKYSSVNFANAAKFLVYLDKYQLIGNKLRQFFLWRSAYLLYQSNQHLTISGKDLLQSIISKIKFLRSKKLVSPLSLPYGRESKGKAKQERPFDWKQKQFF
jgi:hypothetical protein